VSYGVFHRYTSRMTITLHYAPKTRAFTALWLLEELAEPYALNVFHLNSGHHKSAAHLALNPMGKVPVVVIDGVAVAETGAIALCLADRFPHHGLAPAITDARRGAFLRWMFFAGSVIEPCLGEKFFKWSVPASNVAWGSFADMQRTLDAAVSPGPYLLGDQFSAADVVVGATARFGVMFGAIDKQGPIAAYVERLTKRPAFQRALAIEAKEAA
jgi:glutathione S-transferase